MSQPLIDLDAMMAYARDYLARTEAAVITGRNPWRNTAAARWEHTLRVLALARKIARAENADRDLVTAATIFHDAAKLNSSPEEHAARGALVAKEYLTRAGFPADWIARVGEIIASHTRAEGNFALEDRVLRDADILDETGATGIVWTTMNTGIHAPSYVHARENILTHDRHTAERAIALMLTPAGRALAEQRLAFVDQFIAQLDAELEKFLGE